MWEIYGNWSHRAISGLWIWLVIKSSFSIAYEINRFAEYVTELITDARQISQYLGKRDVDVEDIRLAKEMAEKAINYGPRPNKQVSLSLCCWFTVLFVKLVWQLFRCSENMSPGKQFCSGFTPWAGSWPQLYSAYVASNQPFLLPLSAAGTELPDYSSSFVGLSMYHFKLGDTLCAARRRPSESCAIARNATPPILSAWKIGCYRFLQ